jgi:pimeloyl-ACP methyl ester carboxylesterase
MKDFGHLVPLEAPNKVAERILRFLNETGVDPLS